MIFDNIRNSIDFFIRSKTRFSRKNFVERNESTLERVLNENLYTTDIMSRFFYKSPRKNIRTLDIGCKNWFYAKGQYEFYKNLAQEVYMDGIELDAFRLYTNFYSRYEVAKFYIKGIDNIKYIPDNLLNLSGKYDYITWILPFVLKEPHKYWGLPLNLFYPKKLLVHAFNLLDKGGQMLIINQGEAEASEQEHLLKMLNIPYKALGEIKSEYFEYQNKRYGFLIVK